MAGDRAAAGIRWSPRPPAPARRSRRSWLRSTRWSAEGLSAGGLPDETVVVYVSPLKALSNDIQLNLEAPLAGIREELARLGLADVEIRTAVRTGDTPTASARRTLKRPPHLLVTTPESLYVLLGSASGRVHAANGALGHRRRDPCRGREQARQPPGAVARTAGSLAGAARRRGHADRRLGDAETDRRNRPVPRRRWAAPDGASTARSSTSATPRHATSRWSCHRRRWRR